MIRTVIIEDEERSRTVLQNMLGTYCPELEVVDVAASVEDGVKAIRQSQPELLFLDIQLTDGTGFDILEQLDYANIAVIFTTAYDQYAIKAFRFSAVDYLLKPIDIDELKTAIQKITAPQHMSLAQQKLEHLLANIRRSPEDDPVLLVSTMDSIEFVNIRDILRCEADGAYCTLIMKDGTSVMVSKVIKEFEMLLQDYGFYRVHQSHIINMREIRKFSRPDNALIMRDGKKIQLARSRKEQFFDALNKVKV